MSDRPDLTPLETTLARLRPASGLDRDGLLFAAGRRAGWRAGRPWRLATIALGVACLGLLLRPAPPPRVVERIVEVPAPAPSPPLEPPSMPRGDHTEEPASVEYLLLRQRVLADGVDALPIPPPVAAPLHALPMDRARWTDTLMGENP